MPTLRVRVGVTSGEALVSHDPAGGVDAVGDVVNTAARLESAAPLDGVLVDGWTYRATERAIRYEPAEAVEAKGKSEPVEAWVAVAPRSIVPEQVRVGGLPLVGRDGEADVLRGAWIGRGGSRRRSWCRSSVSRGSASPGWSRSCCAMSRSCRS